MTPSDKAPDADDTSAADWFEERGLKTEPLPAAPKWHDESDNHKPKKKEGDPDQGLLF